MSGFAAIFLAAVLIVIAYFACFELKKPSAERLMPIVMLVVIGSLGRVVFAFIPQVQPTTAIVIIAGAVLGSSDGFMTGALCALASNLLLGQGPWTPFQMIAWGTVGLLAGLIAKLPFGKSVFVMTVYSAVAAMIFSVITDFYTVSTFWDSMTVPYALSIFTAGLIFNISHAVGNVIFMLILYYPLRHMLERVRAKYI